MERRRLTGVLSRAAASCVARAGSAASSSAASAFASSNPTFTHRSRVREREGDAERAGAHALAHVTIAAQDAWRRDARDGESATAPRSGLAGAPCATMVLRAIDGARDRGAEVQRLRIDHCAAAPSGGAQDDRNKLLQQLV